MTASNLTASNLGAANLDSANLDSANSRSATAERPQKKPAGNCGPMCQQSPLGAHGHDMYPQEFVRLIGCSDQNKQSSAAEQETSLL